MVIREILDGFDKAIAAMKSQQAKLQEMRDRVLTCCKEAEQGAADAGDESIAGRIGCPTTTTPRRKRRAA